MFYEFYELLFSYLNEIKKRRKISASNLCF